MTILSCFQMPTSFPHTGIISNPSTQVLSQGRQHVLSPCPIHTANFGPKASRCLT